MFGLETMPILAVMNFFFMKGWSDYGQHMPDVDAHVVSHFSRLWTWSMCNLHIPILQPRHWHCQHLSCWIWPCQDTCPQVQDTHAQHSVTIIHPYIVAVIDITKVQPSATIFKPYIAAVFTNQSMFLPTSLRYSSQPPSFSPVLLRCCWSVHVTIILTDITKVRPQPFLFSSVSLQYS